jgi:hypothetical protein
MFGFKFVGCDGEPEVLKRTAGGTIEAGDLVHLKTDGQVEVVAAGEPILGVALAASTSGNPVYVLRGNRLRGLMDSDEAGDAMAADQVGSRVDMVGATGAMQIDISSKAQAGTDGDTGQLIIRAANPQGYGFDTDTSIGIVEIIEAQ